jgi:hypothetical protein
MIILWLSVYQTKTQIQATKHDCLTMGDRDWKSEKVYGEENNILSWAEEEQPSQIVYWHDKTNEPTKEGPLLNVLQKSQIGSTVSRGHPSLGSLSSIKSW